MRDLNPVPEDKAEATMAMVMAALRSVGMTDIVILASKTVRKAGHDECQHMQGVHGNPEPIGRMLCTVLETHEELVPALMLAKMQQASGGHQRMTHAEYEDMQAAKAAKGLKKGLPPDLAALVAETDKHNKQ